METFPATPVEPFAFPASPEPATPDVAPTAVERVLRDPEHFVSAVRDADAAGDLSAIRRHARFLVATLSVSALIAGCMIGARHGSGLQMLYASIKLPLALLLTVVLCAPPFVAVVHAARLPLSPRATVTLTLTAAARFAVVCAALGPVVWLFASRSSYFSAVASVGLLASVAGLFAADVLTRVFRNEGARGLFAALAWVAVFGLVGSHVTWVLRPWILRRNADAIPFVQQRFEGDLVDGLWRSVEQSVPVRPRVQVSP